jgi:hypothetical protein
MFKFVWDVTDGGGELWVRMVTTVVVVRFEVEDGGRWPTVVPVRVKKGRSEEE